MRSVLVTGASTGIGEACVQRLASAGWRVFATVRREADAERLRSDRITPLLADVTDDAAVRAAGARVVEECGADGLHGIVNNAGIAVAGPLEFLPPAELRHQLNVNVVGQVAMAQAVLPALRRARGRIIMVGSIAGRSAMPFTGAYSASKFALEAVADSWRVELAPWDIDVVVIEPGVIMTPIWKTAAQYADNIIAGMPPAAEEHYGRQLDGLRKRVGSLKGLPADAVARVIERALTTRSPRARYVVGRDAKARVWLNLLPTRVRDRLIIEGVKRL